MVWVCGEKLSHKVQLCSVIDNHSSVYRTLTGALGGLGAFGRITTMQDARPGPEAEGLKSNKVNRGSFGSVVDIRRCSSHDDCTFVGFNDGGCPMGSLK